MTFLAAIAGAALFGTGALVTSDRPPVARPIGVAGLALAAIGASVLSAGGPIVIGDVSFAPTPFVQHWLVLGALAGMLLFLVALATRAENDTSGPILLCLAMGGLAMAARDDPAQLLLGSMVGLGALPLCRGRAGVGELRAITVSAAVVIVGVAWMGPHPGSVPGSPGPAIAGAGFVFLASAAALALRSAAVPLHRRAALVAESVGSLGLPVVLALAPASFAVVLVGWVGRTFAFGGDAVAGNSQLASTDPLLLERGLVLVVAAATILLAAVAAWIQDDLRHLLAYSIVADAGFLLLGLVDRAGSSSDAARIWALILVQVTFALGACFTALESAFGSSAIDNLSGWARRLPVLTVAILAAALATIGLPGLEAWTVRQRLADSAVGGPLAGVVLVAGAGAVVPLVRLIIVGLGLPSPRVRAGVSERPTRGEQVELAWSPRPIPPRDPVERFAQARARSRWQLNRGRAQTEALWIANRTLAASVGALLLALLALLTAVDAFGLRAAAAG